MKKKLKEDCFVDNSELDPHWEKYKIKSLHRVVDDKFIVFTNERNEFDWVYTPDEKNPNFDIEMNTNLISKVTCIKTKDLNISEWGIQQQFRELLGEAFSNIYNCNYKNALELINKADRYITKRNFEVTRCWSMVTYMVVMLICTIIGFLLIRNIGESVTLFQIFEYSLFGSVGVFIASFMNMNKQNMLIEVGLFRICLESIVHSLIGISLAFIGLICVKNNLILPSLNELTFEHSEVLLAICFSCCEGFFPRLISKFDSSIEGEENVN